MRITLLVTLILISNSASFVAGYNYGLTNFTKDVGQALFLCVRLIGGEIKHVK